MKSLKNDFYKLKSDQDQIFGAKSGPKGPDLGFGQITIGKSQIFSKVEKMDFFWSDWAQNWSKRSAGPIILAKTLKLSNFWDFWGLLVIFVIFDPFWKRPFLADISVKKYRFASKLWRYTSKSTPRWELSHRKSSKVCLEKSLLFYLMVQ